VFAAQMNGKNDGFSSALPFDAPSFDSAVAAALRETEGPGEIPGFNWAAILRSRKWLLWRLRRVLSAHGPQIARSAEHRSAAGGGYRRTSGGVAAPSRASGRKIAKHRRKNYFTFEGTMV
jgi:hypothetical protein